MDRRGVYAVARHLTALAADAGRPDADLLGRYAAGRDGEAFAELVRRHGPMVWAACRHLLPCPADAEDAFQATFLALARSAHRVHTPAALGGWLHGVAVRAALKVRRAEGQRKRRERAAAGPEAGRPVPDSAWGGLLAAVHEEVERLPEALRAAFVLCDLEGVLQPEAAARLGWKPGTLSGRLTKARQRLLDRLTKRGLAPAAAAGGLAAATAAGAVPAALAQTVLKVAADPSAASAAVSELVAEVTAMTYRKARLLAAGLLAAGGVGLGAGAGRMANLTAQAPTTAPLAPAAADAPAAAPLAAAARPAAPAAGSWEYRFAPAPGGPEEKTKALLTEYGAAGWEYAGELPSGGPRPAGIAPTLAFKRPRPAAGGAAVAAQGGLVVEGPALAVTPAAPAITFSREPVAASEFARAVAPEPEPVVLTVRHLQMTTAVELVRSALGGDAGAAGHRVTVVEPTRTVVLFGVPPAAADRLQLLLKRLDVPAAAGEGTPAAAPGIDPIPLPGPDDAPPAASRQRGGKARPAPPTVP